MGGLPPRVSGHTCLICLGHGGTDGWISSWDLGGGVFAGWVALGMTHFTRVRALWSFGVVSDIVSFVGLGGGGTRSCESA